jgi:hypothetical protein
MSSIATITWWAFQNATDSGIVVSFIQNGAVVGPSERNAMPAFSGRRGWPINPCAFASAVDAVRTESVTGPFDDRIDSVPLPNSIPWFAVDEHEASAVIVSRSAVVRYAFG